MSEEKKKEKELTADYELNKENLEKVNDQLNHSFEETKKRRDDNKKKDKKKKKSGKELLAEEDEKKRKEEEEKKKKEKEEDLDPMTVRGRMNLIYLAHVQRRREMYLARMEMKSLDNVISTLNMTGKAMAEYLFLTNYAMKPDGTFSEKRLDGPVPTDLLEQKNGDREKIEDWLVGKQGSDEFTEYMDDMAEMAPAAFVSKMAGEYAKHMKAERQMKDPDTVQVAPVGFHAPGASPVSIMPGILQDEPAAPVLKPMQDGEENR